MGLHGLLQGYLYFFPRNNIHSVSQTHDAISRKSIHSVSVAQNSILQIQIHSVFELAVIYFE
jgi:hypothetical protein